ncbi:MAG: hypothetical protein ACPG4W_04495 [Flavobacteriales bacterium]
MRKNQDDSPQIEKNSHGIYIEQYDSLFSDPNVYNNDNVILTPNLNLRYNYSITKEGKRLFVNSFEKDWTLVDENDTTALDSYIEADIFDGNPMEKYVPEYTQTTIQYRYPDGYSTMTGVVENSKNLWMHPPRAGILSLLELSSFPLVMYPIELNQVYDWNLLIGSHYGHKDFIHWEGNIKTVMSYEVKSKEKLDTDLGSLDCFVIHSKSASSLGIGYTKLYFNETYGFVKTEFRAIDGTEITLQLVDYRLTN